MTAQVVLIINFFIMLNLALTTLPLYPLAVLLCSDPSNKHMRHEPLAERLHKIFTRHSSEVRIRDPLHAEQGRIVQPLAAVSHGLCHMLVTALCAQSSHLPDQFPLLLVYVSTPVDRHIARAPVCPSKDALTLWSGMLGRRITRCMNPWTWFCLDITMITCQRIPS